MTSNYATEGSRTRIDAIAYIHGAADSSNDLRILQVEWVDASEKVAITFKPK